MYVSLYIIYIYIGINQQLQLQGGATVRYHYVF